MPHFTSVLLWVGSVLVMCTRDLYGSDLNENRSKSDPLPCVRSLSGKKLSGKGNTQSQYILKNSDQNTLGPRITETLVMWDHFSIARENSYTPSYTFLRLTEAAAKWDQFLGFPQQQCSFELGLRQGWTSRSDHWGEPPKGNFVMYM